MWAAFDGQTEAVRLLLSKGADLEAKAKVRCWMLSCSRGDGPPPLTLRRYCRMGGRRC